MPNCAESTGRNLTVKLRESDTRKLRELEDYAIDELHLADRYMSNSELFRIALHAAPLTPDIASIYRQIQAEDGRRSAVLPEFQIVNGDVLSQALAANVPIKFALNDRVISFIPYSQTHESTGLDYRENSAGNAVGGILRADTVEFFRHLKYPDHRLKEIWSRLTANPEAAALKSRRVIIVQDLSLF